MNWVSLGVDIAKLGGPMLASVFLGPEAGPLASVVMNRLASAFGVAPTADAVQTAIKTDPDAAAKVATVEAGASDVITAYLADVQNARAANVQLVQAGSVIAWGPVVVSALITLGFFGLLILMLFTRLDGANPITITILNVVVGTLGAAFTQVCNYWLGSTKQSADKTNALVSMAQTVTPATRRSR